MVSATHYDVEAPSLGLIVVQDQGHMAWESLKERILFTTTELTNKIDTLAEISMQGCRKARAIGAGHLYQAHKYQ